MHRSVMCDGFIVAMGLAVVCPWMNKKQQQQQQQSMVNGQQQQPMVSEKQQQQQPIVNEKQQQQPMVRTQSRNLPTDFFSFWACAALAIKGF